MKWIFCNDCQSNPDLIPKEMLWKDLRGLVHQHPSFGAALHKKWVKPTRLDLTSDFAHQDIKQYLPALWVLTGPHKDIHLQSLCGQFSWVLWVIVMLESQFFCNDNFLAEGSWIFLKNYFSFCQVHQSLLLRNTSTTGSVSMVFSGW